MTPTERIRELLVTGPMQTRDVVLAIDDVSEETVVERLQ